MKIMVWKAPAILSPLLRKLFCKAKVSKKYQKDRKSIK